MRTSSVGRSTVENPAVALPASATWKLVTSTCCGLARTVPFAPSSKKKRPPWYPARVRSLSDASASSTCAVRLLVSRLLSAASMRLRVRLAYRMAPSTSRITPSTRTDQPTRRQRMCAITSTQREPEDSTVDHVANAAHGAHERVRRLAIDLVAKVMDVELDHFRSRARRVVPDILGDLVAAQHLTGVAHQVRQELELSGGQLDLAVTAPHIVARAIKYQVRHAQRAGRVSAIPTAESADAGQQLLRCKRLGHVIVGASIQASNPISDRIPGCEQQDWRLNVLLTDLTAYRQAVDFRQQNVQDDEIVCTRLSAHQTLGPVICHLRLIPGLQQRPLHRPGHQRLVLDDQNTHALAAQSIS